MCKSLLCSMVKVAVAASFGSFMIGDARADQLLGSPGGFSPAVSSPVVAFYPPGMTAPAASPVTTYRLPAADGRVVTRFGATASCCDTAIACPQPASCCTPMVVCTPAPGPFAQGVGSIFAPRPAPPMMGGGAINPIPQTYYRTTWKPTPVTVYRPSTSRDPITGCPVTVMQPCTTYRWEPQRRRCGFFGRLFGWCDPVVPVVPVACVPTCAVASDCCGTPVIGSPVQVVSPSPTPAGYYTPPGATAEPGWGASGVPSASPSLASPPVPPAGTTPGAADVRPSLKPATEREDTYYPPSNSEAGLQWEIPPAAESASGTGATSPLPSGQTPADSMRPGSLELRPVPDPDATPAFPSPSRREADPEQAPQLLNPRDQVARAQVPAWPYTTITWPKPAGEATAVPVRSTPSRATEPVWDESGWQSLRAK